MALLDICFQYRSDAPAVRAAEGLVRDQSGLVGAHGQLSAQDLLVVIAAHRNHGDVSAGPVHHLERLFDRVVVRFVDRIHEVVALDIASGTVELNLVFRSIRNSFCANQNLQFPMLAAAVWLFSLLTVYYADRSWWLGIFLVMVAVAAWIFGEFVQRHPARRGIAWIIIAVVLFTGYGYALEGHLRWRDPITADKPGSVVKQIREDPLAAVVADGSRSGQSPA